MRDLVVIRDAFSPLWVVRCRKPCGRGGRTSWCQDEHPGLETCWLASSATQEGGAADDGDAGCATAGGVVAACAVVKSLDGHDSAVEASDRKSGELIFVFHGGLGGGWW